MSSSVGALALPSAHLKIADFSRRFVKVWEQPEAAPRQWLIRGLVPEGAISIWYGSGGSGKSYIALYAAMSILLERPFLGHSTRHVDRILYLDAELDQDEFSRRSYAVARGMGLSSPPKGLYYYRLPALLSDGATLREVTETLQNCGIKLVVLDSFTMGFGGIDVSQSQNIIPAMFEIGNWGSVIAIDHVAKTKGDRGEEIENGPIGSVFKTNAARYTVRVRYDDQTDVVTLQPRKTNFSKKGDQFRTKMTFTAPDDPVQTVSFKDLTSDERTRADKNEESGKKGALIDYLRSRSPEAVTVDDIAEITGISKSTISPYLTSLKKLGRIEKVEPKSWRWTRYEPTYPVD